MGHHDTVISCGWSLFFIGINVDISPKTIPIRITCSFCRTQITTFTSCIEIEHTRTRNLRIEISIARHQYIHGLGCRNGNVLVVGYITRRGIVATNINRLILCQDGSLYQREKQNK